MKPIEVVKVVSCNCLSRLSTVTHDLHLVVESNDTNLAITRTVGHAFNLRIDSSFDALDSRHVCHSFLCMSHKLLRAITKFAHHLSHKFGILVTLELMITFNRLRDAHRARDIHAEDHGDILCCVPTSCCILHLGGGLEKISHGWCRRYLFFTDHDLISMITELTLPRLVAILLCQDAMLIEDGLTFGAHFCVASGHLTLLSQATKFDFENIGVKLLSILVDLLCSHRSLVAFELLPHDSLLDSILVVTAVEVASKIVGVHLLSGVESLLFACFCFLFDDSLGLHCGGHFFRL